MAGPSPGPVGVLVPQWTIIGLAAGILLARLHLRLGIQKLKLQASDVLLCATWCSAVAFSSFDIVFARMGVLDRHVVGNLTGYEDISSIPYISKMYFFSYLPFVATFYFCKWSLLCVYFQLFPSFMRKSRILLWVTAGYLVAAFTGSILTWLCICLPVQRNWSMDPQEMCPPSGTAVVFQVSWALHFFGDLLIFSIPWLIIPGLQLRRKMKISVYCTFLLGTIDIAFCIVRFATIQAAAVDQLPSFSLIELWSSLDATIALVIACLPSLGPYFRKDPPSSSHKTSSSSTMGRPNSNRFSTAEGGYA